MKFVLKLKIKKLIDIEWITNKKDDDLQNLNQQILLFPANEYLNKIVSYCELGDYGSIDDELNLLINLNASFAPFCNYLKKHLRNYNFDEIIQFIDQHK